MPVLVTDDGRGVPNYGGQLAGSMQAFFSPNG
jgi:hypothetical protein